MLSVNPFYSKFSFFFSSPNCFLQTLTRENELIVNMNTVRIRFHSYANKIVFRNLFNIFVRLAEIMLE